MYKIETHLHVAEVNSCAKIPAGEMAALYAEAGYRTIFVSDHFKQVYTDRMGRIPWCEKIARLLSGYEAAEKAGAELGLHVLMSAEISFEGNPNHYLVYGIDEDFLISLPELCRMSAGEFYGIAKEQGILTVQAHPYRDKICYPTPECVDGMEVVNSNPRHEAFNEKALAAAKEHQIFMTAGSDAHRLEDIGRAGMLSEEEIKCAADFIALVKSGAARLFGGE